MRDPPGMLYWRIIGTSPWPLSRVPCTGSSTILSYSVSVPTCYRSKNSFTHLFLDPAALPRQVWNWSTRPAWTASRFPQIMMAHTYWRHQGMLCCICEVILGPSCGCHPLGWIWRGSSCRRYCNNAAWRSKYENNTSPSPGWKVCRSQRSLPPPAQIFLCCAGASGPWLPHETVDPGAPWLCPWIAGPVT